jgi:hypothetical protein
LQIPANQIKLRITTEPFTMSDKPKEPDPFKPTEPNIPGVTGNPARSKPAPEPPRPEAPQFRNSAGVPEKSSAQKSLSIAAIVIVLVCLALYVWKHSSTPVHAPAAPAVAAAPVVDLPPVVAPSSPDMPVAPGPVATTAELAKAWSSKRFVFRATQASENIPALVVHLPSGVYWGISMRQPYGTCELEYVTDLGKLERQYRFHADHPMVADPCNRVVFDLARYGTGPNGEVRGAIVSGRGVRPPIGIEVRVRGKQVFATQLEQ